MFFIIISHFKAVIKREIIKNKIEKEGVSSTSLQASNIGQGNLIKACEGRNKIYKETFEELIEVKDYSRISYQEILEIIEGISRYFDSVEEKEGIKNYLEILFRYTNNSTFSIVTQKEYPKTKYLLVLQN